MEVLRPGVRRCENNIREAGKEGEKKKKLE